MVVLMSPRLSMLRLASSAALEAISDTFFIVEVNSWEAAEISLLVALTSWMEEACSATVPSSSLADAAISAEEEVTWIPDFPTCASREWRLEIMDAIAWKSRSISFLVFPAGPPVSSFQHSPAPWIRLMSSPAF